MKRLEINAVPLIKKMEFVLEKLAEARLVSRYRRIFKGKGLEFLDFRPYTEQDDSKRIDWKTSVKANKLLIKEFKEERDLDVYFLVDCSSSMVFGSTKKLKNEYAAEIVAALTHIVLFTGDKAGLFMFNDKIVKKIQPRNIRDQYYIILRALSDPNLYYGGCDLNGVVEYIMGLAKREALLVIVSDFFGLRENWADSLKIACTKFDTIGIMVRDPRDEELPKNIGKVLIKDPFSGKEMLVDPDSVRDQYAAYTKRKEEEIERAFTKYNADFLHLRTDKDFIKPFLYLLRRREGELV